MNPEKDLSETINLLDLAKKEVAKVIVGQTTLIDRLFIGLLAEGHLLLEGVPGIAKTMAVNTFSKVLKLDFKRIQFTPDLLPSDLTGSSVYNPKEGTFSIQEGPVFTNIVLADEINRAPAKVQSALLEVMQEHQVTISGKTMKTKDPFMVLATQNPIEHEGTYPLPEAQTDRFMMKINIDYPSKEDEKEIVERFAKKGKIEIASVLEKKDIDAMKLVCDGIYIDEKVLNYILDIVFATRKQKTNTEISPLLEYGASPRASIALCQTTKAYALLQGRNYVTPSDVKELAFDVLRHRLVLSYEALAQEISPDAIIQKILETVPVP